MSGEQSLESLQQRRAAVERALEQAAAEARPQERQRVRDEIVSLFRDTERMIEELTALRESIRPLVERYKEAYRASPAPRPATRVDHLGASTYLERGWSAIAGADYPRAVRELRRALELAPGDARGETLLAWARMRLGEYAAARAGLEGVLRRQPDHALARASLGFVHLRQGRLDDAEAELGRVVAEASDRTATLYAHLYLGMVHAERGSYREARRQLQRALELGPNLTEAYWELGRAYHREGRADLALEAWSQGAEANRFNPWGERCGEAAQRLRAGESVSVD